MTVIIFNPPSITPPPMAEPQNEDLPSQPFPIEDWSIDIKTEPGDKRFATFTFRHQDHTLGNSLRHILSSYKEVEFVGYSLPHPSEPVLKLRIQSTGPTAKSLLIRAFNDLVAVCDHVESQFTNSLEEFSKNNSIPLNTVAKS